MHSLIRKTYHTPKDTNMAKQTLKHSINGNVVTRTTARNYTHVLVVTLNADKSLADNARFEAQIPQQIEKERKRLEVQHARYRNMIKAGLGAKARNWNGYVVTISQWDLDRAHRGLNDYGTIDEQIAKEEARLRELAESFRKEVAGKTFEPEVVSWHSSADLAWKASNDRRFRNYDCTVEEINGGA